MAEALLIFKYLFFFMFVHVSLVLPGYALLRRLKPFRDEEMAVAFSYGLSMLLYAGLAILHFAFNVNLVFIQIFGVVALVASAIDLIRRRPQWRKFFTLPLMALFVMSATSIAYVALPLHTSGGYIPDPTPREGRNYEVFNVKILNIAHTPANDNYIPFRQAQFFVNRMSIEKDAFIAEWSVNFFYRTPLMGAVVAFYFDLLGQQIPKPYLWAMPLDFDSHVYQQFQIIAHILNSLFIIPAYLLVRRIFGTKVAKLTTLLLVISPFFLYNSFFSWPKSLVAYFILCSWVLLRKRQLPLLAGLFSGAAYLVHDLAVLYIAGSAAYLLLRRQWSYLVKMGVIMATAALPWLVLARLMFHQTSLFFYYPFSLKEIPADPTHVISEFFNTPLTTIIMIKLTAIYDLIAHLQVRHWLTDQWRTYVWIDMWSTLPGAIGLTFFPFSYYLMARRAKEDWTVIVPFIVVPLVVLFVILGRPKSLGIGAMHFAEPMIPLMTAYGVMALLHFRRWLICGVFATVVASYYFMAAFGYYFDLSGWYTVRGLVLVGSIAAAHLVVAYLFVMIAFDKKPKNTALARLTDLTA